MAGISSSNQNNNPSRQQMFEWSPETKVLASCYSVNTRSATLNSFHYCTTVGTGEFHILSSPSSSPSIAEPSGIPEVPTGHKFPPISPPTNVSATAAASAVVADQFRPSPKAPGCDGEAVQTITEECERLFCDTLWSMFLGERQLAPQQSLVIGATHNDNNNNNKGVNVSEILRKRAVGRIQNFIENAVCVL
ncbi:ornithine decarboxylase antizyme [Histoplasma capsulatum]|uniref:Ornithine decarboxylase antizyme n=1 Tax=Ajellomyces capsulatus TaxID=5037 RepID=A0A8A1M9P9_AJECA|nr:ornithine decarboxylase antizyme [Histoplasma capsulatum]